MSQKILLLHGWGGSDAPHWQAWLAGEIAKEYGCVSFLRFSDYDTPSLPLWLDELRQELNSFRPDVVVCHSLANTLWFHLALQEKIPPVKKLYLVAPPSLECGVEELSEFFPVATPKNLYAQNAQLICSTNDPYMQLDEAKALQKELNIPMKILMDAGHINSDSGYGEWEWILKELKR